MTCDDHMPCALATLVWLAAIRHHVTCVDGMACDGPTACGGPIAYDDPTPCDYPIACDDPMVCELDHPMDADRTGGAADELLVARRHSASACTREAHQNFPGGPT